MKLICDGLELSDTINKVSRALPLKAVNPILEGIKLSTKDNKLIIFASDSELSIQKSINADIIEDGEVLIPGKFFSEYVKRLTDEQVELYTNEKNQLRIKYSDSEGFVQLLSMTDYPVEKIIESTNTIKILQQELKDTIEKTVFSVSIDDSRPTLKGCLFEFDGYTLATVALDGYRMAINKKPLEGEVTSQRIIVPSRSLNELTKLLTDNDDIVTLTINENSLMVTLQDTKLITRLINGEYLNYKQIIPDNFISNIVVNKKQLEESLDRASLPSKQEKNNLVKFEIKEKTMTIFGTSEMSNIKENINVSLKGKDINIAFNARYIADCLRVLSNEFVKISFTSSVSPTILTPCDTDESLFLILPVRMIS